jgi:signal transduction histidine kinase
VIVLSGFESSRMATIALSAGASAYLQKGAAPDRIVTAIAEVRGGQAPAARTVVGTAAGGGASEIDQLRAALATAAHELRSPATILAGLSQTLRTRRERLDAGTVDQLLDAIVRQATVLDRLTADLLTTSQLHRGTVSVDPRPVLLAPVLAAITIAVAEREQISVDCAPDVSVLADQVRVEQMVNNLLANAFKYGAPPVSIEVRTDGTDAVVSVTDRGPGVPSAFLPQLFGQYARADGVRASGTGIGLYVVSSLAQAQGGRAWYDPTPDGLARFRFSLPLVPDAVPTGSAG